MMMPDSRSLESQEVMDQSTVDVINGSHDALRLESLVLDNRDHIDEDDNAARMRCNGVTRVNCPSKDLPSTLITVLKRFWFSPSRFILKQSLYSAPSIFSNVNSLLYCISLSGLCTGSKCDVFPQSIASILRDELVELVFHPRCMDTIVDIYNENFRNMISDENGFVPAVV